MIDTGFFRNAPSEPFSGRLRAGSDAAASLVEALGHSGLPARIVPASRANDLRDEILERHHRHELAEEVYRECLTELDFGPPADLPDACSIVVAAVPRPETAAVFHVDGAARTLTLPPTYTDYRAISRSWLRWLGAMLAGAGYRVAATGLPLKLLATRSGLAAYGRNNITYVPGLGSYFELVAAYTDVACPEGDWDEPGMLDRCRRCRACVNRCPTGAIRLDRFLLETERCLVFHNERAPEVPFPGWIDPSAHHALIGCMACQWACPENRELKGRVGESQEFSEDETRQLVAGARQEDLSEPTVRKLERLDALRFLARLPRNLGAALR